MKTLQVTRTLVWAIISFSALLYSCQEDDSELTPSTDFTGTYFVEEEDPDDSFTLIIEKHESKKGYLQIRNFGGFMNIPIDGKASGNMLEIPTQTFSEGTKELILSGTANFVSDTLIIDYQVRGFTSFDSQDRAIRQ